MSSTRTEPSTADRRRAARARASAIEFAARHGKPSRAVVENIGRWGARVVLVGADGALGDIVVPSVAAGQSLVESVTSLEAAEWDAETTAALTIGPWFRRKMAGPHAGR